MDMKGWDTISFLGVEAVNSQLAAVWGEDIAQFQYSDGELSIQGRFGPPKIVSGGSNKALRVSLPIISGTAAAQAGQHAMDGCSCCISVMLQMIPEGDSQTLLFDLRRFAKNPEEAEDYGGGWVIPIAFQDPGNQVPKLWRLEVLECVCQYLIHEPALFSQLLARIAMGQGWGESWFQPTQCAYAYLDSARPTLCVLGLCNPFGQLDLPLTVDPPDISAAATSCLAIAGPLFLSNTFIPALKPLFRDIMAGTFEPQNGWLQNRFPLEMTPVSFQGMEYTLLAESIRLAIVGNQIAMTVRGSCDLDPVDAELDFTLDIRFSMDFSGQTAQCQVISSKEDHSVRGSSFFDIPIVGGLMKLLLQTVSDDLLQQMNHTLSNSHILLDLDAVDWLGRKNRSLLSARLEDCLLLEYDA